MLNIDKTNIDYENPVEIAEGIYWVGFHDTQSGLHCNPYLIVDNEEAFDALINSGLEVVNVAPDEYRKTREALGNAIASLGDKGLYTPQLYEEMLGYIAEYRANNPPSAGSAADERDTGQDAAD